jgi:hypothetical protein
LKAIKAEPLEHRHEYIHETSAAPLPPNWERSSFFKLRSLSVIFKLRKQPRAQLKEACKLLGIDWKELVCDMPVRWNSTDKLLKAAKHLEGAIRRVLERQQWDKSVRENLTPTDDDWEQLREMEVFFDIFRKATIACQAENYPTLHNTIPDYLHMIRQLNIWQNQNEQKTLKAAAEAAYKALSDYLNKAINTRHSCVALLCDPRYKLEILEFLYEAEGGENSPVYKKAKAHFQHVFSYYQRRAVGLAEWDRQQAENATIEARGSRSPSPEIRGREAWRVDPFHGYDEFIARRQQQQLPLRSGSSTEVDQWFREPCLLRTATPEEQKAYMQSKAYDFPIITQMALDFMAIPATSAPSERIFSQAGNLISKKRTRISSENVRYVLCLRSWGLLPEDDEKEVNDGSRQVVQRVDDPNTVPGE